MATGLETSNFDWQNNYTAHLTNDITNVATDIFLDTVPSVSEGCLVIDPDTPANFEVIYFNSKTSSKVTTPANGRGYDGSTAIAHLTGVKVIMAPIGDMFRYIRTVATTTPQGWSVVANTPNTVTANGNRSYQAVFNSVDLSSTLSVGQRLKLTKTVTAPTQCTSLNGTTQFYSKTAPAGMTFTDDFTVSAWIKLSSYTATDMVIASRYNGTSGWSLVVQNTGSIALAGRNGGSANVSYVFSYQSVPLNKWVHVTAQLDMSTFTATPTTSYVMLDGVDVLASVARGGTNPTALVQAGNLEIGSQNGGTAPFPGKIAQVAIYNAKVTQATILASISQTLVGTETSLISAYSFNNSINDLNANANNLTANGSAVATNADTPFAQTLSLTGYTNGTTNFGLVTAVTFSTNTTVTIQVPEGDTIPTSGGVSAVSYSTQKVPFAFPNQQDKWAVQMRLMSDSSNYGAQTQSTWLNTTRYINVPIGDWIADCRIYIQTTGGSSFRQPIGGISTSTSTLSDNALAAVCVKVNPSTDASGPATFREPISLSAATVYYVLATDIANNSTAMYIIGSIYGSTVVKVTPSTL